MENADENLNAEEYQAIGARVKELRKSKGYKNYEHIAFDLGMSRSAYWKFENGSNFEIKTMIRFCRLIGVTLGEAFAGIDLPKEDKK